MGSSGYRSDRSYPVKASGSFGEREIYEFDGHVGYDISLTCPSGNDLILCLNVVSANFLVKSSVRKFCMHRLYNDIDQRVRRREQSTVP